MAIQSLFMITKLANTITTAFDTSSYRIKLGQMILADNTILGSKGVTK